MMVGLIHCKGVELFVLGLGLERNHLIRVEYDSKANLANIYIGARHLKDLQIFACLRRFWVS